MPKNVQDLWLERFKYFFLGCYAKGKGSPADYELLIAGPGGNWPAQALEPQSERLPERWKGFSDCFYEGCFPAPRALVLGV